MSGLHKDAATSPSGGYIGIPWLAGLVAFQVLVFHDTWMSLLDIWLQSDTFSHGLLIIPISIYLVWRHRGQLDGNAAQTSVIGFTVLAGLSMGWWLSMALGMGIGMHLAVVAMLPATVLAFYGSTIVRQLAFPLAFLVFAVPFGQFVIPELVDVTASLTVSILRVFGIPVIRDGQFFEVPSGSYSIARACAGLNYTIATLALATLLARLNFRRATKGAAFVVAAVLFSILANGVRATMIVLIMHFSDFDISAAKDHEFVGWIAYFLLIALLLFLAGRLGDRHASGDSETSMNTRGTPKGAAPVIRKSGWAAALIGAAMVGVGVALSLAGTATPATGQMYSQLPRIAGWQQRPAIPDLFRPAFGGFTEALFGTYENNETTTVYASVFSYRGVSQGAEMINAVHTVLPHDRWRINLPTTHEDSSTLPVPVLQTIGRPRDGLRAVLVWYWYEVNGRATTRTVQAKIMEAKNFMSFRPNESVAFVLATPIRDSLETTQQALSEFLGNFYPAMLACTSAIRDQHCISAR